MAANPSGTYRYMSVRKLKALLRYYPDTMVVGANWIGDLEIWDYRNGDLIPVNRIDMLDETITEPRPAPQKPEKAL